MPRSVAHDVDGGELRVWKTADDWLHVKLAATRDHDATTYDVESRWDIPPQAAVWAAVAGRARDGESSAAEELATHMFTEAVFADDAATS